MRHIAANRVTKLQLRKLKLWFERIKSGLSCIRCGENHIACLDFHHPDRRRKRMGVSQMVHLGFSVDEIQKEMAKCQVLCSNCHRKLHWTLDRKKKF